MFKRNLIAVSLAFAALASAQVSAAVVGGGATLPEDLYGTTAGTGILAKSPLPGFNAYIGVGSGAGKRAFFNNNATEFGLASGISVDYAGSDSVVSSTELDGYKTHATLGESSFGPLIQVPMAATSVTVPFNVSGMSSVNLTSQQLVDIFTGKTTNWNQVGGPNKQITVVYRLDGSGTTEIFVNHLKAVDDSVPAVSNNFATAVGFNPLVNPPAGSVYAGGDGSNGVVAQVNLIDGAIGYVSPDKVEYGNAAEVASINGKLPTAVNVQETLGNVAPPSGAVAAANPVNWAPVFSATNYTGYPIVGVTNLLFSQCYKDAGDNTRIRNFLDTHYTGGNDAEVSAHSLIPLPAVWQSAVHNTFWNTANSLRIGDTSTCNGIGRPL
ncbi:substrate-binding domain-containing protein [Halopseudomonas pelagia]|uniref:substrate-binding domain-containing protein n=1 Tax=Halopseudomonas pelagia TaxID=553151 RepID=UPI00039E109B|nr:substrate-binding domain-containing protein [Halopseudomonas pelagia]